MSSEVAQQRRWTRYFAVLAATAIGVVGAVASLSFAMDPYDVWGHSAPLVSRYRPWLPSDGPQELAARVQRPATILIGDSRAEAGFAADSPAARAWGPTLVEAVEHSDFTYQEDILAAAVRGGRLQHALIEIDPRELLACQEERPAPSLAGAAARVLLLPAFGPSLKMLATNVRADLGEPPAPPYRLMSGVLVLPERPAAELRTVLAETIAFRDEPGRRCDPPYSGRPVARLERLAEIAAGGRVQLVLFVGPWRPMLLRSIWQGGDWPRFEAMRRRLAAFAGASGVPVWDFSTAALQAGDPPGDRDFYDLSHFKPAIGARVLSQIESGEEGMGWRLTPAGVDARLAADRGRMAQLAARP